MTFGEMKLMGIIGYTTENLLSWQYITAIILCAVAAYFLGSLNFAIIISKYKYHNDIRSDGSGNAGLTNMMRVYGKKAAVFTLLGDGLKAVVSVLLAMLLTGEGAYIAAVACVLGHAFPAYYKFRGGKGVLVTAFAVLCLEPVIFLILIIVFAIIVGMTKYVSLGSMMAAMMYPVVLNSLYPIINGIPILPFPAICSVLIAFLILFLHRENISRLRAGKENKLSFHKK